MNSIEQDFGDAVRQLKKAPELAIASVLTLIVAIGVNTPFFSQANRMLHTAVSRPCAAEMRLLSMLGGEQRLMHGSCGFGALGKYAPRSAGHMQRLVRLVAFKAAAACELQRMFAEVEN